MGKATIIDGGADGLYTIKIDAGAQQQASRVEAINQELTTVAERIAQAETEYLATTTAETNAMAILNVAIEAYASAVQADPETASTADVDRLTGAYYEASAYAAQARVRLQALMLQQRQLESDKSNLAAAPAEETREAWCVDLTEDASGDVATIEVPGEPGTVLVAPGGRAPSAGDGALLARELMTPEQAFFNAAILPGWQKWMPTFRTGTITAINSENDTADVSLDAATSSAQGLGINQAGSLSGVPIEYMECNAAAFEVGDPCVVRFDGQSWDAPKVVGFAREPKACGPEFVTVAIAQIADYDGTLNTGLPTYTSMYELSTCGLTTIDDSSAFGIGQIPHIVGKFKRTYKATRISYGWSDIVGATTAEYKSDDFNFFNFRSYGLIYYSASYKTLRIHGAIQEQHYVMYPLSIVGTDDFGNIEGEYLGTTSGAIVVCYPSSPSTQRIITYYQEMIAAAKQISGIPDYINVGKTQNGKKIKYNFYSISFQDTSPNTSMVATFKRSKA